MHRHSKPSRITNHVKIIAGSVAGLVAAATFASAPLIAHATTMQLESEQATASLSQQGALDSDHLGVYGDIAAFKAEQKAAATIVSANAVIAAAASKVDASELQTSVAELGDYKKLPAEKVTTLTSATVVAAQKVRDAIAVVDAQAAAAAAEALRVANTPDGARAQGRELAASQYGWGEDQFQCLDRLWTKESNWRYDALNASSGATGIVQALPGSKMATAGPDWATNARTQIIWGLDYIARAYGTPCGAWGHSQSMNWY